MISFSSSILSVFQLSPLSSSSSSSSFHICLNPNPNLQFLRENQSINRNIEEKGLSIFQFSASPSHDLKEDAKAQEKAGTMLRLCQIIVLQLILALAISTVASLSVEKDTIYEILRANGLPMGLLPKGVKEFKIDDTGSFVVYLDQPCNAKFESELHYEANVSGTLGYGRIGALSGISAQELFLWFPIKGIRVDVPSSGVIYFDVGVVRKQLSMSLFETPRDCVAASDSDEIQRGQFLAEAVTKIQSQKLRLQLDQEASSRKFL